MNDRVSLLIQHLLPKRALTVAAGAFAGMRAGTLTHFAIRRFIGRYGVTAYEAARQMWLIASAEFC